MNSWKNWHTSWSIFDACAFLVFASELSWGNERYWFSSEFRYSSIRESVLPVTLSQTLRSWPSFVAERERRKTLNYQSRLHSSDPLPPPQDSVSQSRAHAQLDPNSVQEDKLAPSLVLYNLHVSLFQWTAIPDPQGHASSVKHVLTLAHAGWKQEPIATRSVRLWEQCWSYIVLCLTIYGKLRIPKCSKNKGLF